MSKINHNSDITNAKYSMLQLTGATLAALALTYVGYSLIKRSRPALPVTRANAQLTALYKEKTGPDQVFKGYRFLEASRVHILRFKSVDTTMRIAEEF